MTGSAERVLSVTLEYSDGWPRRRYHQLAQDGARQARRAVADVAYARANRCPSLATAHLGVLGVPL